MIKTMLCAENFCQSCTHYLPCRLSLKSSNNSDVFFVFKIFFLISMIVVDVGLHYWRNLVIFSDSTGQIHRREVDVNDFPLGPSAFNTTSDVIYQSSTVPTVVDVDWLFDKIYFVEDTQVRSKKSCLYVCLGDFFIICEHSLSVNTTAIPRSTIIKEDNGDSAYLVVSNSLQWMAYFLPGMKRWPTCIGLNFVLKKFKLLMMIRFNSWSSKSTVCNGDI